MTAHHTTIDWDQIHQRLHDGEAALEAILHPTPEAIELQLQRRADELARRRQQFDTAEPAGEALELLVFGVGEQRLGIPLHDIVEIGPMRQCTPVPGADPLLCGIMHHRGEVRSVIDMGRRLGETDDAPQTDGYFLHVKTAGADLLFRVDALHQLLTIEPDELLAPGSEASGGRTSGQPIATDTLRGMGRDGLMVLRTDVLCAPFAVSPRAAAGTPSSTSGPKEKLS